MKLELGCGSKPTPGYAHADRIKHSDFVDLVFDLEVLPWPLEDGSCEEILAVDVLEHIHPWVPPSYPTQFRWMDECWRILEPGGLLNFRLPHYKNEYAQRDPDHWRAWHIESFDYWCIDAPGSVRKDFGAAYGITKTWSLEFREVEAASKDLRFKLRKITGEK